MKYYTDNDYLYIKISKFVGVWYFFNSTTGYSWRVPINEYYLLNRQEAMGLYSGICNVYFGFDKEPRFEIL